MDTNDPLIAALETEFASIGADFAGCGMDDETAEVAAFLRAIRHREQDIADEEAYHARRVEQLRNQIEGIKNWRGPSVARLLRRKLAGGKKKSLRTPYGVAGFRHKKARITWEKEDEARLLEWAKANLPDAVSTSTPEPRETLRKEVLVEAKAGGVTIPGTTFIQAGDEFYTTTASKEPSDD